MAAGNGSQPCLLTVQTVRAGAGKSGSAKAPTATVNTSGSRSRSQNTVEPQVGQKWKVRTWPLSPARGQVRCSPSIDTIWLRLKNAFEANSVPVRRWQARQWQDETSAGSPSRRSRNWPQWQAAWRWTVMPPGLPYGMAEILALGLTHYPPLWGPDERMSWIFRRMLTNPKLPETLRSPEGWPAPARTQWADDQGAAEAGRHRAAMVAWFRKTRAALDAFKPDFVLMWGDDQYENFKADVVPPYCLLAYERFKFATPPGNVWSETDKASDLAGHPKAAQILAARLIAH